MLSITTYHINFVSRNSLSSGQQPTEPTAVGIWLALNSKVVLVLNLVLVLKSKAPYYRSSYEFIFMYTSFRGIMNKNPNLPDSHLALY